MSGGLQTTLDLLSRTSNEAALGVLIPSLDSPAASIREGALVALLGRRNKSGHREVLRRLHTMDDRGRDIVCQRGVRMSATLRGAILGEDRRLCVNACRAAVWLRDYDRLSAMLSVLEDIDSPHVDVAGAAILELTALLRTELAAGREAGQGDLEFIRERFVTTLGHSVMRFREHRRREVVEAFARIVRRDDPVLRNVLAGSANSAFACLSEVLLSDSSPSVIRLLLSFLDGPHTPSNVILLLCKRSDPAFVERLLHKIGRRPSTTTIRNLKRMNLIHWLRDAEGLIDDLDETAQHALVNLVMLSSTSRPQAFEIVESLLSRGKTAGRRAASEALSEFSGAEANSLALEAIEDDDPQVRANIVSQIRRRGIPGALTRLIELVDSPHPIVREAARRNLTEFRFKRYLAAFDMLDEEVRRSTGLLVKKIDPQIIPQLQTELNSDSRSKVLRALEVSRVIDVVGSLEELISGLLDHEDHIVRAEAATALGRCESSHSDQLLQRLASEDPSPAVRQAAAASLREKARFAHWRDKLADPRD